MNGRAGNITNRRWRERMPPWMHFMQNSGASAACWRRSAPQSSTGIRREKNAVKRYATHSGKIRARLLMCLPLLLTACNSAPRPVVVTQTQHAPLPESLTQPTPVPSLPRPLTWGGLAVWSDRLLDALESCNADKAAIKATEQQRRMRP
ncbi:Rz1-like lysis system protein LysC [Escherichia coli]|uniref:Rz1-like lysis system protein LysC n=2 Tax=Escherichia coli TaxID=562 RepID=UPI004038AB81